LPKNKTVLRSLMLSGNTLLLFVKKIVAR